MKFNSVLAISLLTAGAMAATGCSHKNDKPTPAPPVRVSVMAVGNAGYAGSQIFSGTVASANSTTVSFAVTGTIEELYAEEGQRVGRGQLLGRLKDGDYVNADNIARAELAEAQDAYNRLKKLHDANALPEIKWVEMEQKLKQAQNAAQISRRALDETKLSSPMAGVVSRKIADRGQNVAPIEPVYEIVSTDNLTVDISVPENEVNNFDTGREATVKFDGVGEITGKVTQRSVVADPLTRSYKVKIAIPAQGGKLLPGMVGTVVFSAPDNGSLAEQTAVMLPSQAVGLNDDNRTYVWTVRDGKAERRFVEADRLVAEGVLIRDGIAPGDTVIVEGMQKVGSGSPVVIVNTVN